MVLVVPVVCGGARGTGASVQVLMVGAGVVKEAVGAVVSVVE